MPKKEKNVPRPPVVVVIGHVDHGKSTLLDYIRKTDVAGNEHGSITQHIAAYEVEHKTKDGKVSKITFLDTPGHEAFSAIRSRGALVADVAVLVVSAEDGVKPQTLEALKAIKSSDIPFVVAINKIDKPNANVELVKQSLAENEVYLEGYGGDTPFVPISAITGAGVSDLLDVILILSEFEELKADESLPAEGIVIESNVDRKVGNSATLIIKNGTLSVGMSLVSGKSLAPVRFIENYLGQKVRKSSFSSPVKIFGWNELPAVGSVFQAFIKKKEAEKFIESQKTEVQKNATENIASDKLQIPIIVKADTAGSLEAILKEINKLTFERIVPRVTISGIGQISEKDIQRAIAHKDTIILGFNTEIDTRASRLAEREAISPQIFNIIYKLTEWLSLELNKRIPKITTEEVSGTLKILKVFSVNKDKQVTGGRVDSGLITKGNKVRISRRSNEIGVGVIKELQKQKSQVSEVGEGSECGLLVESKIELAPGDVLTSYHLVTS